MSVQGTNLLVARRSFLRGAAGFAACAAVPAAMGRASAGTAQWAKGYPFALGVAAGDPMPAGFVIWTRLAPEPLSPDPSAPGGMSGPDVPVAYEVAKDPAFKDVIKKGEAQAEAEYAYSVHVEVRGLEPGRPSGLQAGSAKPPRPRGDSASALRTAGAPALWVCLLLAL